MKSTTLGASMAAAGLFAGAVALALHQQAGYIAAAFACERGGALISYLGVLTVVMLGAGALTSWLVIRRRPPSKEAGGVGDGRPLRFLAMVSLMAASLFLFAIVLQASAVLFLAPCKP